MVPKKASQADHRANRFALHLPVYFRELNGPNWLEGTTENISYTGLLFLSSTIMTTETVLELRLQITTGSQGTGLTEIGCKGKVVRLEQRSFPKTPIAVGVAIRDYCLSAGNHLVEALRGLPESPLGGGDIGDQKPGRVYWHHIHKKSL